MSNPQSAHRQTPGVSADAKAIDTPLAPSGPRDALVDYNPDVDVVPGLEDKGYHVGLVRQPAELVGVGGRAQGFRSTSDHPSKFVGSDLKAAKNAHNAREAAMGDKLGVAASPEPMPPGAFVPGMGFVPYAGESAEIGEKPKRSSGSRSSGSRSAKANPKIVDVHDTTGNGEEASSS